MDIGAIIYYITLIVVFFAGMILIGIKARSKSKSVDGYVLGGRSIGPWLSAFAYGTSYFSAVIFIGYAGQFGWRFGTAAIWIGIGNAVIGSFLAWKLLGKRTRTMSQQLGSSTMPDFFGKRFQSKSLRIGAAIIIFIFLIPYTASLYNGLGRLFEMAFIVPFEWCVIAMAVITAIYVILGGYVATAWSDFIQGIIMLGGIVAVIVAVVLQNGGIIEAFTALSQISDPAAGIDPGAFTSIFGPDIYFLVMVVLLTSFGTWGLPQMVQKFYSIKNESSIKKGMIISTIFAVIVAGGCYFLGSFARLYSDAAHAGVAPGKINYDAIVPAMLETLPVIMKGVLLVLIMAASMSTLSSLVMSSGSTITLDLIKGNIKKDMTDKQQLLTIRIFVAIFILISSVIAIIQYNLPPDVLFIAQMMAVSWGALAGSFLAPYVLGMFWKRVTKAATWASFGVAVALSITALIFSLCGVRFPADGNVFLYGLFGTPIFTGVWAMVAGLIVVPIVSLFTQPPDKEYVNGIFEACKTQSLNKPLAAENKIVGK